MAFPEKARPLDDNRVSGIYEAPIDDELLREIGDKIAKGIRTRVMTCLKYEQNIEEGKETNSQLLMLYERAIGHQYFEDCIFGVSIMGKKTLFALELYLYRKGLIHERKFQQIMKRKTANRKNKPAYLDID